VCPEAGGFPPPVCPLVPSRYRNRVRVGPTSEKAKRPSLAGKRRGRALNRRKHMAYEVTFERIGRTHPAEPVVFNADDTHDLAAVVWKHARRFLGSRFYMVSLDSEQDTDDPTEGSGLIEGGRFGSFTWREVVSAASSLTDEAAVEGAYRERIRANHGIGEQA
jgi:hypothetical protein